MSIIYAAIALLDTRYFAELKPAADAQPLPAPKGKGWYWGGLAFGAIVGMILYPHPLCMVQQVQVAQHSGANVLRL